MLTAAKTLCSNIKTLTSYQPDEPPLHTDVALHNLHDILERSRISADLENIFQPFASWRLCTKHMDIRLNIKHASNITPKLFSIMTPHTRQLSFNFLFVLLHWIISLKSEINLKSIFISNQV